ncbi:MAG TPA: hypothetical protein VMG38_23420 [Trebonia sp.]|nr:hypothetical protein [Trebonia sp.]
MPDGRPSRVTGRDVDPGRDVPPRVLLAGAVIRDHDLPPVGAERAGKLNVVPLGVVRRAGTPMATRLGVELAPTPPEPATELTDGWRCEPSRDAARALTPASTTAAVPAATRTSLRRNRNLSGWRHRPALAVEPRP